MAPALHDFALVLAAWGLGYLVGSIPFSILISRWRGVNLLQLGSGNLGASNAFVVAGKLPGVLVLLGDAAKGIAAVAAAAALSQGSHAAMAGAAVGAVVGHDWSLYLRLRGGKGTATTVGVIFALDWRILGLAVVVYGLFLVTTRYTVISSLLTVASVPGLMMLRPWLSADASAEPQPFVLATIILAAIGFLRHWDHVERLLHGREPKAVDMFREMRARKMKG